MAAMRAIEIIYMNTIQCQLDHHVGVGSGNDSGLKEASLGLAFTARVASVIEFHTLVSACGDGAASGHAVLYLACQLTRD